jgi:hypothetical protein
MRARAVTRVEGAATLAPHGAGHGGNRVAIPVPGSDALDWLTPASETRRAVGLDGFDWASPMSGGGLLQITLGGSGSAGSAAGSAQHAVGGDGRERADQWSVRQIHSRPGVWAPTARRRPGQR